MLIFFEFRSLNKKLANMLREPELYIWAQIYLSKQKFIGKKCHLALPEVETNVFLSSLIYISYIQRIFVSLSKTQKNRTRKIFQKTLAVIANCLDL